MHFYGPPRAGPEGAEKRVNRVTYLNPPDALDPDAYAITFPYAPSSTATAAPSLPLSVLIGSSRTLRPVLSAAAPPRVSLAVADVATRKVNGEVSVPSALEQQLRKLYDALRLFVLRRDHARATRALLVLMRSDRFSQRFWLHDALRLVADVARDERAAQIKDEQAHALSAPEDGRTETEIQDECEKAAVERRLEYLKVIWLRVISSRATILPLLVADLCTVGKYSEAQDELQDLLHRFPYRLNPDLQHYAGLLVLILAHPAEDRAAIWSAGTRTMLFDDEDEDESDESSDFERASRSSGGSEDEEDAARRRRRSQSVLSTGSVTRRVPHARGIALSPSAASLRAIPTRTLALARTHFETAVSREWAGYTGHASDARLRRRTLQHQRRVDTKNRTIVTRRAERLRVDMDVDELKSLLGRQKGKGKRKREEDEDEAPSDGEPESEPKEDSAFLEQERLYRKQQRLLGQPVTAETSVQSKRGGKERARWSDDEEDEEPIDSDDEEAVERKRERDQMRMYYAAEHAWAVELAGVYIQLITEEEEARGGADALGSQAPGGGGAAAAAARYGHRLPEAGASGDLRHT